MKYSLIGLFIMMFVLLGVYVYTGEGFKIPTTSSAPAAPQNDSGQYGIKIE